MNSAFEKRALLVVAGFVLAVAVQVLTSGWRPGQQTVTAQVVVGAADTSDFADQVLTLLLDLRLEHPYVVFAQAKLESGNFTSDIFKHNNNLFGMKMPWRRATLATGVNRGHAVYSDWRHSVYDYALWQSAYMRGLTQEQYLKKLSASYADDDNYIHKLRRLL